MPPRSVKMKRFIFGFQRRVWWPKWTPASSSSFMETTGMGAPFYGSCGRYKPADLAGCRAESRGHRPMRVSHRGEGTSNVPMVPPVRGSPRARAEGPTRARAAHRQTDVGTQAVPHGGTAG